MPSGITAKPQKLTTDNAPLTRDELTAWDLNHRSLCRQTPGHSRFLPGGTRSTWNATRLDNTNGFFIKKETGTQTSTDIMDPEKTQKLRDSFQDFLTTLAANAPTELMETILQESTSYRWVIDLIKVTFNLTTAREMFLKGDKLELNFSDTFNYQQGWMKIKNFYMTTLLPKGSTFMGTQMEQDELISPLAYNLMVKEWLHKINPQLPNHVMKTRGHLFTTERPTLACNQTILATQIGTMLQEIDKEAHTITNTALEGLNTFNRGRKSPRRPNQQRSWGYPPQPIQRYTTWPASCQRLRPTPNPNARRNQTTLPDHTRADRQNHRNVLLLQREE